MNLCSCAPSVCHVSPVCSPAPVCPSALTDWASSSAVGSVETEFSMIIVSDSNAPVFESVVGAGAHGDVDANADVRQQFVVLHLAIWASCR